MAAVALVAAVGLLAGCGSPSKTTSSSTTSPSGHKGTLVVGAAGFSESEILAYMYADLLHKLGYTTKVDIVESSEIFTPSLERGQIAVAPEYAATYADELQQQETGTTNPNAGQPSLSTTYHNLQRLAAKENLVALAPSRAVDQNAFAVTKSFAAKHHVHNLSELGASHIPVTIAGPAECATRPYCVPGLKRVYGIKVTGVDDLGFDTIQAKTAVEDGKDQVAEVGTTDPTLSSFHLVLLPDNKHLQNADYVTPIINKKYDTAAITSELDRLSRILTTSALTGLDGAANERIPPQQIASGYLTRVGLL